MTGYVATRWYRAPEIMLNWMHYNQTGDASPRCGSRVRGRSTSQGRESGGKAKDVGVPISWDPRPGAGVQKLTFRGAEHGGLGLTPPPAQGFI